MAMNETAHGAEMIAISDNNLNVLVHRPTISGISNKSDFQSKPNGESEEKKGQSVLGFILKPNPVKDFLIIENTNALAGNLILFDLTGKQITYQQVLAGDEWHYSVSDLENGIYLLRVSVSKKQGLLKVFKI